MKNKRLFSVILIIIMLSPFCFVNVHSTSEVYLALGDSIAAGYGLKTTSERYTNIIASKLGYSQVNLAVSGHKTSDLINVLNKASTKNSLKNAKLITVSIGGNDFINSLDSILGAISGNEQLYTDCENRFNEISNILKTETRDDCIIIYQNVANCYKYTIYNTFVSSAIKRLNSIISKQCDNKKIFYCDIATQLEKSGDNFFATQGGDYSLDPHPTKAGHKVLADVIYAKYKGILVSRENEVSNVVLQKQISTEYGNATVEATLDKTNNGCSLSLDLILDNQEEIKKELSANKAVIYNLDLVKNDVVTPLSGQASVKISCPSGFNKNKTKVYYIDSNGNHTDMKALYNNGYLIFETSHFSKYAVVELNYLIGDINNDGSIDNHDLVSLMKYLSNQNMVNGINEKALDINGDNYVNNKDLTRLFEYISGWNVYIY